MSRLLLALALLLCACFSRDTHPADRAVSDLDVYPGLEATLFASEPLLSNPTNIDVDERGRVWVCDVVNYREHGRNDARPEGDRILILEDSDGDGEADSHKVYYQGRDVDAALGLAVLGNEVFVTAAPNVIVFTDEDGDDKPDRKEYLFTDSGAPQSDHSTHSVVFGPDGKLYWNMGNSGRAVHDRDGNLMRDRFGEPVVDRNQLDRVADAPDASPYHGGMVFRSNLDGSEFEVLGHNFRNNYEVTVDSFGGLWQSDNDDDGNYAVRLNYILEYGNYGYRDELTGDGWQAPRTGAHSEIPHRHWHQNDPGVVPNLLLTGAGSPTGITVYEGTLLPEEFHGQPLHADAGPGVLRAVVASKQGAGYTAKAVNLVKGERDKWVRPVDVAVAPDGAVYLSDWYDPVVGWNRQYDQTHGRIFRIAPAGHVSTAVDFDFDSIDGALAALENPNYDVRYQAWNALHARGAEAQPALEAKFETSQNPRLRARSLWLLSKTSGSVYPSAAFDDPDEDIRIVALRAARQLGDPIEAVRRLVRDLSPQVRRECAIALRGAKSPEAAALWAELAMQHDGADRWYLEALGIGAHDQWDTHLAAWLKQVGAEWNSTFGRDLIWRSRARTTPDYLARILLSPKVERTDADRYLRAFDFQPASPQKSRALRRLALTAPGGKTETFVASEALIRLEDANPAADPTLARALDRLLDRSGSTAQFAELVSRFELSDRYPQLMEVAVSLKDEAAGAAAMRTLIEAGSFQVIEDYIRSHPDEAQAAVEALGAARANDAIPTLERVLLAEDLSFKVRGQAVRALAGIRNGPGAMVALAKAGRFPEDFKPAAGAAITRTLHVRDHDEALQYFPVPASKNSDPIPNMTELLVYVGNAENGKRVFESNECIDCHIISGEGTNFGPDLSKIGDKLPKAGLYEAILDPSASVSPSYELINVSMANGDEASGFVISDADGQLTLRVEGGGLSTFPKSDILDQRASTLSAMPDDLQKDMTVDELVDLVEYLAQLR